MFRTTPLPEFIYISPDFLEPVSHLSECNRLFPGKSASELKQNEYMKMKRLNTELE